MHRKHAGGWGERTVVGRDVRRSRSISQWGRPHALFKWFIFATTTSALVPTRVTSTIRPHDRRRSLLAAAAAGGATPSYQIRYLLAPAVAGVFACTCACRECVCDLARPLCMFVRVCVRVSCVRAREPARPRCVCMLYSSVRALSCVVFLATPPTDVVVHQYE